jgi:hypothetical protein
VPLRFLDELCLDAAWDRIARESKVEKTKESADRRVYRLSHPTGVFYVKQHVRHGIFAGVKDALLGDPARREFDAGCYAKTHGVPTIAIVAYSARKLTAGHRAVATISVAENNVTVLAHCWIDAGRQSSECRCDLMRRLTRSLPRLIATAHDAAFLHPDNHPGNILVRNGAAAEPECVYVDLYGVRLRKPVEERDAAKNLAVLDQWFRSRATRTQRFRFLKAYAGLRRKWTTRAARKHFAALVQAAAHRHARKLYAQRDRRISRRNAFFDRQFAEDGAIVMTTRRFRRLPELLDLPTPDLAASAVRSGDATSAAAPDTAETFYAPHWTTAFAWRIGESPAWRKYRSACLLMNRDVPTVVPLACRWTIERQGIRQCGWRRLRPADGATMREWLDAAFGRVRCQLLDAVGRLIADTLARGAVIHDASAVNIEVSGMLRGNLRVYWAGVHASAVRVPAPRHVQTWMLARLAARVAGDPGVTHADRARVLRACCRRLGIARPPGGWKPMWREIASVAP